MRDLNRGDHDEAEALKFVLGNSGTAPYNSGMCKPLEFCSDSLNGRAIATSAARLDQVVEAARKRQRHRSCICIGSRFFTHANRKRDTRSGPYAQIALDYALKHNPQLALFRENRGMAAAGIVLAKIYPFNPIFQSHDLGVNGPTSAGITSHFFTENYSVLPLELNGQGRERRASAAATATRTEWEIAGQEVATAILVLRAYDTVLYREQKLKVLEDTVAFSEQVLKQTRRLADAGRLGAADVLFAGTELDAAPAQVGQGAQHYPLPAADFQRQLGILDDRIAVSGELDPPLPALDEKAVGADVLEHRPEIHARVAAIAEAESQLRLQIADRFGNLAAGPRCDYSETRANFIGVVITGFIPVFNTRQGRSRSDGLAFLGASRLAHDGVSRQTVRRSSDEPAGRSPKVGASICR